jgi:hypothetical protein
MTKLTTTTNETELWTPADKLTSKQASEIVCGFLDTATTSFGRATHYNTREEQQAAELKAHDTLMDMSRDLYAVFLALPGVTDRAVQLGMKKLLSTSRNGVSEFMLPGAERELMYHLIQSLPTQRMLKMIDAFRVGNEQLNLKKANNARTRKLILRVLLSSPRLQLWSVKYRSKVKRALIHAWGQRLSSIIREIVSNDKKGWTDKEKSIIQKNVVKYAGMKNFPTARECISYALGGSLELTLPLFVAAKAAKKDITAGSTLPPEVLEGIRSTFHPGIPKEKVLELTRKSMTAHQKMAVQKRAKAAGIKVEFDPEKQDAVRLYLYAFECGLDDRIEKALEKKAKEAAQLFPTKYEHLGVIVDGSASMAGDETQALRPMATALAMRDMLMHTGDEVTFAYCGGAYDEAQPTTSLVKPMGDTALADSLVDMLSEEIPEAVFVISDGYENAPAGRFAEVMHQLREMDIDVPVYHLNPVMAAEAAGVRELAPEVDVPTLPVQQPKALGTTFVRGMLEAEPVKGINALVRIALKTAQPRALLK